MDALYEECRGHDLVLVPDPPMASALNRRLEEPTFGTFATTPRRFAAGRRESKEDRIAFLQVIEETDLAWKEAAYAIGNVLQCWDNRGDLGAILEYDQFDTAATREVIACLRDIETTSKALATTQIEDDRAVAVVGIEEFTALERSILPDDYTTVNLLTDASFDRPPFRLLDSTAAVVDTVLDSLTAENADRVAIVLDAGSQYSPLIESALEAADIPFYGGPGFADDPAHRAFLRLLRTGHAGSNLRVADVRPILRRLGAEVPVEHDGKRLRAVGASQAEWLTTFCAEIADHTFGTALAAFESEADLALDDFRTELDELGLLDQRVTDEAVGRLSFYVEAYDVPVDRENEGVLLADATAAATVDRPAVFYLGMDEGWTHAAPRRPWVDRDEQFTRNLQQFQRLLQNGVEQHYLVQDERGGRAVTPCLYFEALLEEEFERFSDLDAARHARATPSTGQGFDHEPLGIGAASVETVSQSALTNLVNCPRDHLFGQLVDEPDRDYFTVGNLFHDFAEVYADDPDRIDDEALDAVVDLMVEATRPFDRDEAEPVNRTRYRLGLETIVEYLDANPPVGAGFLTGSRGWWSNDVADYLGLSVDAPYTEWWFEDEALGLKGKIDLVDSPTALLDYKSSSKKSATQVVRRSAVDPTHDTPDYQALAYLAYLRRRNPDEPLSFTFFHFLETLDDAVAGDVLLEDCLTSVRFYPVPFEEYVSRESVFETLREDGSGDCCKTFEQVEYGLYADVVDDHPFPDGSTKAELSDSPLGDALYRRVSGVVGEYAYVENGCAQALSYLAGLRDANYFADDVDAFEAFVQQRIAELNRYRSGEERFPVSGLDGETHWRWVDHRDMLLEGDA